MVQQETAEAHRAAAAGRRRETWLWARVKHTQGAR